jgi:multidrug efflux pump subunit AcrA (membrane-fusion protein)
MPYACHLPGIDLCPCDPGVSLFLIGLGGESSPRGARPSAPARADFRDGAVAQLGAPLDGRIVKVHVQIGNHVREGDPLLRLDCPDAAEMRAAVESATASLREARSA